MLVRKSLYGNMRPNPGDLYDPRDGSCLPNFNEAALSNPQLNEIEQDLVKYDIQLVRDPPSSNNSDSVSSRNLMLLAVTEYAESLPAERTTANPFVIDKVFFREAVAGVLELHHDASDRDLNILQANLRKCLPDPSCLGGLMLDQFSAIIRKISILQHGQEYFYTNLRMAFVEISKIINQVCSPHNFNARSVLVNLPYGASYAILDRNRYLAYLHEKEQLMRKSERLNMQRQSLRGGQREYTLEDETNAARYGGKDHGEFYQDQQADLLDYSRNQTPLQTHYIDSKQMPGHYNENQQIPGHHNDSKQMPGHYIASKQIPGHYNGSQRMPGHYNENQHIPGHYNENQQMSGHYNENQQMSGHYNNSKQISGHYNEDQQIPGHFKEDFKFQTHHGDERSQRTPYNTDEKLFRANTQMLSENGSLKSSLDYNSLTHYKGDKSLSNHDKTSYQMSTRYREGNQMPTNYNSSNDNDDASRKQFIKYPMETSIQTINGKKVVIYHDTGETVGYEDYLSQNSYNQASTGSMMNNKSLSKSISNLADNDTRNDDVNDYRKANLKERIEPLIRDRSKSVGDLRNDEDKIDRYPSLLIVPGRKQVRKIHTLEESYDKWKKKSPSFWGKENEKEGSKTSVGSTNDGRAAIEIKRNVIRQDTTTNAPHSNTKPIISSTRGKLTATDSTKQANMNSQGNIRHPVIGGRQPVLNSHNSYGQPNTVHPNASREPMMNSHTGFRQSFTGPPQASRQPVMGPPRNNGPVAMAPRRNFDQMDARPTIADKVESSVLNQGKISQYSSVQQRSRRNSGDSTISTFSEISIGSHLNKDVEKNFNNLYKSSLQRGARGSHYAVRGTVPESDSSFAYEATPGGSPEPMGDTLDRGFTYRAYPTQIKRN